MVFDLPKEIGDRNHKIAMANEIHYAISVCKQNHTSYIASSKTLSKIDLSPRAPVFLSIAFLATIFKALSVKCNFTCRINKFSSNWLRSDFDLFSLTYQGYAHTSFILKIFLYCLHREFFGSVST
jgi:hypothetical protein